MVVYKQAGASIIVHAENTFTQVIPRMRIVLQCDVQYWEITEHKTRQMVPVDRMRPFTNVVDSGLVARYVCNDDISADDLLRIVQRQMPQGAFTVEDGGPVEMTHCDIAVNAFRIRVANRPPGTPFAYKFYAPNGNLSRAARDIISTLPPNANIGRDIMATTKFKLYYVITRGIAVPRADTNITILMTPEDAYGSRELRFSIGCIRE